ncbi:hypothetical protein HUG17_6130 [Dermatophagoides farinae]|uniref:Uncharacterized protein n=1 Tax=Dermatophagoides farinae TaxID=6954 RepID=A0A9D4P4G9_DERFA|nr:hypothetical protein HUG17_6130 [Dermatophagoides farinae]
MDLLSSTSSSINNMNGEDGDKMALKNVTEIKEWISLRLEELEEKNQLLKKENKKVNAELSKLKERYHLDDDI